MTLRLSNTLTGRVDEFKPLTDTVRMYTCGMTVQDRPHAGHMRAYVTSDVLRRYLKFLGFNVVAVQNVTDIDDKIIARSKEDNTDYRTIGERYHQEFLDVADRMNIQRSDLYPRATQHIQEMIELIEKLLRRGFAYVADGDVYYDVPKFADYGKLSKKRLDDLIAGFRVETGDVKHNPADFALWKAAKPEEPYWFSPWGKGRPGWHIECSAMAMHYLGETIDIHLGGEDTIFPHHENEIAQSEAATGKPFARFWVHNAHLNLTGEKMSKSTKHYYAARDILDRYDPNALRLYFLKALYKSPIEFNFERLDEAAAAWTRIDNFLRRAPTAEAEPDYEPLKAAMDDDLNTPHVLGLAFDAVSAGDAARVKGYLSILGFALPEFTEPVAGRHDEAQRLLDARQQARQNRDFALADRFRDQLIALGYVVEDTPQGPRLIRKEK